MSRAEQLFSAVEQAQFPYLDSLIHLFVGGSELHGARKSPQVASCSNLCDPLCSRCFAAVRHFCLSRESHLWRHRQSNELANR